MYRSSKPWSYIYSIIYNRCIACHTYIYTFDMAAVPCILMHLFGWIISILFVRRVNAPRLLNLQCCLSSVSVFVQFSHWMRTKSRHCHCSPISFLQFLCIIFFCSSSIFAIAIGKRKSDQNNERVSLPDSIYSYSYPSFRPFVGRRRCLCVRNICRCAN